MKITKITAQQKQTDRVNIFVEGAYAFSLTLDQLLQHKVKVGIELSEADMSILRKVSEDGKLRARALEWVMLRPRSSKELRTYLQKKKADEDVANAIVNEFATKKYQDDAYFAQWWVDNRVRKLKSDIAIRSELMQKGIATTIINDVLSQPESQKQRLKELVAQKQRLPKYSQDQLKFKKYLLSKGFRYSDIDEVLAEESVPEDGSF